MWRIASSRRSYRGFEPAHSCWCSTSVPGAADFKIAAATENGPTTAATYGANVHADDPLHAAHGDTTTTTPGQLVRALKLGEWWKPSTSLSAVRRRERSVTTRGPRCTRPKFDGAGIARNPGFAALMVRLK